MCKQNKKPKVAVLLAVFNGMPWLTEQLRTIQTQSGVDLHIYISDDGSTDETIGWINKQAAADARITLLKRQGFTGSAGQNFYRLIENIEINLYDYVAFSDQDDIWNSNKLISHIKLAKQHNADGVSSNVTAFWPNGREKLIIKSQPQRANDYLFESAGPGCSFLMTQWLVSKVREQLIDKQSPAKTVELHDWLTYAVCRSHEHQWVIDATSSLRYRQHENNVLGANSGFKAKLARLRKLKHGWYRTEVTKISLVSAAISDKAEVKRIAVLLERKGFISQMKLLFFVSQSRRKASDRFVIFALILCFIF